MVQALAVPEVRFFEFAEGLPAGGWTTRSDKTIGENSKNPNLGNGKGLDHLADSVGPQVVGIYFQALGH